MSECSVLCEPEAGRHTFVMWLTCSIQEARNEIAAREGRPYRMVESNPFESCAGKYEGSYVHLLIIEASEPPTGCPYQYLFDVPLMPALTTIQLVNDDRTVRTGRAK